MIIPNSLPIDRLVIDISAVDADLAWSLYDHYIANEECVIVDYSVGVGFWFFWAADGIKNRYKAVV